MTAPFLELRGITKSFGAVRALDGVSLGVLPGERMVLLGPTGSGKTTALRVACGLEEPDSGDVCMAGESVRGRSPAERDVALVFQNFSLYPSWSVRRNLEFPLRAPGRSAPEAEIRSRVGWAAELLKISSLLDRPASRLSGGEMQRVALGRALVRRPRLYLMDEPLSNLDAKLRESLRIEIAAFTRELRTPLLYVTHDQAEALSIADRIAVLVDGKVQQIDRAEEVYRRPETVAVAKLLGQPQINILKIHFSADGWRLDGGMSLPELGARLRDAAATGSALIGVRPEHVALTGGAAPAVVEVVEPIGPSKIVVARFAGGRLHALVDRDLPVRPGEEIRPSLDLQHSVLWTSDGARRIP
ncbi:MAG: ABC transporter ATP-binding protein [Planctomycetes bacterium]|nr:ABC transporter ATP-binding protein [Planctomycetota bacterium]